MELSTGYVVYVYGAAIGCNRLTTCRIAAMSFRRFWRFSLLSCISLLKKQCFAVSRDVPSDNCQVFGVSSGFHFSLQITTCPHLTMDFNAHVLTCLCAELVVSIEVSLG